jgi:alpha-N-acetylglucosamine transferase
MDELFLLPPSPLAMPRAYWLAPTADSGTIIATDAQRETKFTSTIMLVTPSTSEFDRVMAAVATASHDAYDMEVVNALYGDTARVLPHRPYVLLSQVLRWESDAERALYLGEGVAWDAEQLVAEAKYVHFSDWPIPKPWLPTPPGLKVNKQPKCAVGLETCVERELWNGWYDEYRGRREVCSVALSLCCDGEWLLTRLFLQRICSP